MQRRRGYLAEQKKKSLTDVRLFSKGGRRPTFPRVVAVSSALPGLTSLFGMGRGAPRRHSRHESLFRSLTGKESGVTRRASLGPGLAAGPARVFSRKLSGN